VEIDDLVFFASRLAYLTVKRLAPLKVRVNPILFASIVKKRRVCKNCEQPSAEAVRDKLLKELQIAANVKHSFRESSLSQTTAFQLQSEVTAWGGRDNHQINLFLH